MGLLGRRGAADGPRRRPLAGAVAAGAVLGVANARAAGARQAVAGGSQYQMRQRMFSIGDDFVIQNAQGQPAFRVDGKALRIRSTLFFENMQGQQLYKIQERMIRVRDSMTILRPDGTPAAKVHNALITPLRDRWQIDIPGGAGLSTRGNIVNHEYRIERDGQIVASVSKQWFRIRDSYGVEIAPGQDDALILAITTVVDMMAHSGR